MFRLIGTSKEDMLRSHGTNLVGNVCSFFIPMYFIILGYEMPMVSQGRPLISRKASSEIQTHFLSIKPTKINALLMKICSYL